MKRVVIVHGFMGSPNSGWRPWLLAELEKRDIYARAISMPSPENPICIEWVKEIKRHVEGNKDDEVYLVGHSIGASAILRYLESEGIKSITTGAVLVSGLCERSENEKINNFLDRSFDYSSIKSKVKKFAIIHGDNDPNVPLSDAKKLSKVLGGKLTVIHGGGHLNGASGWNSLPQCLDALVDMMK